MNLALVFNIDHTTAMACANAARSLLSSPAGQALSSAPGLSAGPRPRGQELLRWARAKGPEVPALPDTSPTEG